MEISEKQKIATDENNILVARLGTLVSSQWQIEEEMRYIRAELNRRMGLISGPFVHPSRKPKGKNN